MLSPLSTREGGLLGRRSVNNTAVLFEGFKIIFHFFAQHFILFKWLCIFSVTMWTSLELELTTLSSA
jgi:hypothetical protein